MLLASGGRMRVFASAGLKHNNILIRSSYEYGDY